MLDPNGLETSANGSANGPQEQSHSLLPTHQIQGGDVPSFIGVVGPQQPNLAVNQQQV